MEVLTLPNRTAPPDGGPGPSWPRVKRVAVLQSSYVPWKGYFDLINSVDEFVLYDDVQYTRQNWRNRNRIKTPRGDRWLTIPVHVKGLYQQKIKDTLACGDDWRRRHWETLCHCYGRAPHFAGFAATFRALYLGCRERRLSTINRAFLSAICAALGITTPLSSSTDYRLTAREPTERLLEVCRRAGAREYLSGPAARAYLDEESFRRAGVRVVWMSYSGYPEYPQLYPPFDHQVSVLDLLFMTGPSAGWYLKSAGGGRGGALRRRIAA
jgi:hypothetical protein